MTSNEIVLQSIQSILQQATQALSQLRPTDPSAGQEAAAQLQQAAVAASLVAQLASQGQAQTVGAPTVEEIDPWAQAPAAAPPEQLNFSHGGGLAAAGLAATPQSASTQPSFGDALSEALLHAPPPEALVDPLGIGSGPLPAIHEYLQQHGLELWIGEALEMMSLDQRAAVMAPPLNLEHTHNANGVVLSRIKEVAPVEQRLQMFVRINGLADGVIDRLSTLTPDQQEKVMESSLKIQKANNPSGVAMKRISDVLRNERMGVTGGSGQMGPGPLPLANAPGPPLAAGGGGAGRLGAQLSALLGGEGGLANLANVLAGLGGAAGGGGVRGVEEDRSRSRGPPGGLLAGAPPGMAQNIAPDIVEFMSDMDSRNFHLEWWVGEVLNRLSLWQRQNIMKDIGSMHGVRNPSGVVMSRVKAFSTPTELLAIFIDLNGLDRSVADQLADLSPDLQAAVIAPGIYVQNVRNPSTAVRSRIAQVLAGNDAMGGRRLGAPPQGGGGGGLGGGSGFGATVFHGMAQPPVDV